MNFGISKVPMFTLEMKKIELKFFVKLKFWQ